MTIASRGVRRLAESSSNADDDENDLRSISVGETKQGYVDRGDGTDPRYDDLAESVSLELDAGATVTIAMESEALDAYLVVEGPDEGTVAEDDDGASETDSRLRWHATTSGTHTVWAGSYSGDATGAYTLSVTETDSQEGDSGTSEASRDLRSISYGQTKQGYVDLSDGRDPMYDDLAEPVQFDGSTGDRIAVTMESDTVDAYLLVIGPGGNVIGENDDSGPSEYGSRVDTALSTDGTHTIWAGSYDGEATGSYSLTLEKSGEVSTGEDLRSISYGETKQGYIDTGDGHDPSYGDLAEPVQFDGEDGDRVTVTMETGAFDAYLVVQGSNGSVLAENDDGASGYDSQVELALPRSGTYTVWAGSISGDATGPYTLTLERR